MRGQFWQKKFKTDFSCIRPAEFQFGRNEKCPFGIGQNEKAAFGRTLFENTSTF